MTSKLTISTNPKTSIKWYKSFVKISKISKLENSFQTIFISVEDLSRWPHLSSKMSVDISVVRPNHYYNDNIAVHPDVADGFYIRKAKIAPNNNARNILLDLKMRSIVLDGQKDCERSLYLPLQTGYKTDFVLTEPVEYKTHKPKHQHLYNKYRV